MTAVEWFNQQLVDKQNGDGDLRSWDEILDQANKLFEQQIINAYAQAMIDESGSDYIGMNEEIDAEIYYDKTFKK